MSTTKVNPFFIIGIAIRTSNADGSAVTDIPQLWERFLSENAAAEIPNRVGDEVYCMYTDYEGDHMKPYTTLIGCKVSSLDNIPDGFVGKSVDGGAYQKFNPKGKLSEIVIGEWRNIWESNLPRAYSADFEVYGAKSQNPEDAEIDIFVAVQ